MCLRPGKIASGPGGCSLFCAGAYAGLRPREQAANEGDHANPWRPPLPECVGGSGGRHGAYPPSVCGVSSGTHLSPPALTGQEARDARAVLPGTDTCGSEASQGAGVPGRQASPGQLRRAGRGDPGGHVDAPAGPGGRGKAPGRLCVPGAAAGSRGAGSGRAGRGPGGRGVPGERAGPVAPGRPGRPGRHRRSRPGPFVDPRRHPRWPRHPRDCRRRLGSARQPRNADPLRRWGRRFREQWWSGRDSG